MATRVWVNNVEHASSPDSGNGTLLQSIINAAGDGDVIELEGGTTITTSSGIVIPSRSTSGTMLTIATRNLDSIVAPGTRASGATHGASLCKITTSTGGVVTLGTGTNYGVSNIRLKGLRIWNEGTSNNTIMSGMPVTLFDNHATFTLDDMSDNWELDRCVLDDNVTRATNSGFAIRWDGKRIWIHHCDIEGFHTTGNQGDGYGFGGYIGTGPFILEDNRFACMGENFGYGGHGWGSASDIFPLLYRSRHQPNVRMVVRRNIIERNLSWFDPVYPGTSGRYGKNMFELTYGYDILFEGNIMRNYWVSFPDLNQKLAINIKQSLEGSTKTSLNYVKMSKVVIQNNIFYSCANWLSTADYVANAESPPLSEFVIRNNLCFDFDREAYSPNTPYGPSDGATFQFQGFPQFVNLSHNTMHIVKQYCFWLGGSAGLTYKTPNYRGWNVHSNLFVRDTANYDFVTYAGDGVTSGINGTFFSNNVFDATTSRWKKNVMSVATPSGYPAGTQSDNYFISSLASAEALFRGPITGTLTSRDYRLTAAAEASYPGDDGKPVGCDYAELYAAMKNTTYNTNIWPMSWIPDSKAPQLGGL